MPLLVVLMTVLFSSPAWASITCTGESFAFDTPTDPQAQNYTVPSVTDGITLIHTAMRSSARDVQIGTTTIGGGAVTRVNALTASTDTVNEVFYQLNVAAGVQSISVDFDSAPLSYVLTAVTCGGVNQSSPIAVDNAATGSSTTVSVSCAGTTSSQLVLDFVSADGNAGGLTPGAGQTFLDEDVADATLAAGSSYEQGGGTVTMSHSITNNDWATICVALNAATSSRVRGSARYLP